MSRGILTLRSLGKLGRFGNQLFQLCTGLALARHLGAELRIPADWPGYRLFQLRLPPIDLAPAVRTARDHLPSAADLDRYGSIDLYGFWQFQESLDLYTVDDARRWLRFQDWVHDHFARSSARPSIAIHIRRGDYLSPRNAGRYCCVNRESYYRCLHEQVLPGYRAGEVDVVEVSDEKPQTDSRCEAIGAGFLPDFMTLVNADALIRSNSTFSFWAGVLGSSRVYAPLVGDHVGPSDVPFVQGNHPRFASQKHFPNFRHTDLRLSGSINIIASSLERFRV